MRQMVSFTLRNAGYEVVEAVDGEDAFDKAREREFDLVLTDQNMPRLDGIGLTRRLREQPKFKNTPILILTTESSDQMKQAGRAAGATGFRTPPTLTGHDTGESTSSSSAGIDLSQFHQVFFEEAGENLERIEQQLPEIDIESAGDDVGSLARRARH